MAINDTDIDLTSDSKFHLHSWEVNKHSNETANKIFRGTYRKSVLDVYLKNRRHEIPWCKRKMEAGMHENLRHLRSYGDMISDEANCTIRTTSENNILLLGDKEEGYVFRDELINELFNETIGYVPYNAIHTCWRCGTKFLGRANTAPVTCDKCNTHNFYDNNIPWRRMSAAHLR